MSNVKHCGFCSLIGGLVRRAMCIGSRRGSSESYYRELGDQDTLKIDGSQGSENSVELHHDGEACQVEHADARGRASTSRGRNQSPCAHSDGNGERVIVPVDVRIWCPEHCHGPALDDALLELHLCSSQDCTRSRALGRFLSIHKRRKKRLVTRSLSREEALLDDLMMGQVQCVLEQSLVWDFNAFTLENVAGGRGLSVLCGHLFHVYGLIAHFRLDPLKVWRLFSLFEENYHSNNPYHNSVHAADVTQAMHCFLQQDQILQHMQPIDVMSGLLAAMAHDLDHPGVNQPFLVATSNHLVDLYQSQSVLENHHWRSAISCIIESNLLDEIPQFRHQLYDKIRSLILATDITRQQDYLGQFKLFLDNNTLDLRLGEHRHLVLQIALKCADISNPCRPWEISQMWSLKVCEEFFRQGDIERELKLPPTPLCDRNTTTVPTIQSGFFKYVVTPLITEWHRFLQSDLSEQMLNNLVTNHQKWDAFAKEIEEANSENKKLAAGVTKNANEERNKDGGNVENRNGDENGARVVDGDGGRQADGDNVEAGDGNKEKDENEAGAEKRNEDVGGDGDGNVHVDVDVGVDVDVHVDIDGDGDGDEEDERDLSGSSEFLLPRRSSLNPATTRPTGLREQLRRFSAPLNVFHERPRAREQPMQDVAGALEPADGTPVASERSLYNDRATERVISTENLLPESSIASITTPQQALRINHVFHDRNWRLVRQPTFPPLESMVRAHSLIPRASSHDEYIYPRAVHSDSGIQFESNSTEPSHDDAPRSDGRRVGSQLRENLSSIPLDLGRRRKSMPARAEPSTARERRFREVLPQLLARSLAPRVAGARRGSAPAHVPDRARPPRPARAPPAPRRSSLPVEVISGISSC